MSDVLEKGQCGHFCEACARRDDKIAELETKLNEFYNIVNESVGVAGFHLNGEIATWEYLGLAPPQDQQP